MKREELEKMDVEELDELVHDLKGQEAAEINNGGKDAQIAYILDEEGGVKSEAKHTPGPWHTHFPHLGVGRGYISATRNGEECVIAADFYDEENEPTTEEQESNMRGCAAVPDLIAICLEIANDGRVDLVTSERRMRLYNTLWKAGVLV